MMVEQKKEFDRYNAHVVAGKKAEKEGKQNRDLKIIADEDEVRHKEAHKMAWNAQLELSTLTEKKVWSVLKEKFKNNGKICNTVASRQEKHTLHVEKFQKGVQDMQRILKRNLNSHFLKH
jgi:hypothetical protein